MRKEDAETYRATKVVAKASGALFTGAKGVTLANLQQLAEDRYAADGCRATKRLALAWNALTDATFGLPARALDVTTWRALARARQEP